MNPFRAVVFAIVCLSVPASVQACGFTQVIGGVCSTGETIRNTSSTDPVDKGILRRTKLWTFFEEFSDNAGRSDIELRVCGFLAPPVGSDIKTIDFRGNPSQFRANMAVIEDAVGDWVVSSPEKNVESRLEFLLRNNAGAFNICTANADDFHIKIAFNSRGSNNSNIGSDSARTNPSMNLSVAVTSRRVSRRTVLHEFGHALGFGHEMMHPLREDCMRKFDAERWLDDFLDRSGGRMPFGSHITRERQLEIARANIQVIIRNLEGLDLTSNKDDASIMSYPITQASFASNGAECEMTRNSQLSRADRALSLTNYGRFAQ